MPGADFNQPGGHLRVRALALEVWQFWANATGSSTRRRRGAAVLWRHATLGPTHSRSLPTTHAHTRSVACGVVMIIVSHDAARATGNPHLNADGLQRRFAIAAGRRRLEGGSKGYSCSSQLQWLCWAGVSRGEDPDVTLSRSGNIA